MTSQVSTKNNIIMAGTIIVPTLLVGSYFLEPAAISLLSLAVLLVAAASLMFHNTSRDEHTAKSVARSNSLSVPVVKPIDKSKVLNIVIVGAGLIGPRHAKHVKSNGSTNLYAIIDLNPAAKSVASELGCKYFSNVAEMISFCDNNNEEYPDGAIVCTPNHTHIRIAAELASHGINLLVEKPLSSRADDSKALKIYCSFKKVKVLVGHHRRFNPFIIATKKHLSKVGRIIAIQGTWTLKKDEQYFKDGAWRTDSSTGGGTLLINLVHDLDLLQYLFGPIAQVYAEPLPQQRDFKNVDEGAVLTMRFKSGCCGTFICADNVTSPFNFESGTGENPNVPLHGGLHGLYRIFGSHGTLSIPDFNLYLNSKTDDSSNHWLNEIKCQKIANSQQLLEKKPFDSQLDHFVDIINENHTPNCDIDDGISALLVINSVRKSIETGMPQVIPDLTTIKPDFNGLGLDLEASEDALI